MVSAHETTPLSSEPVVIRCGDRVIKGYLDSPRWSLAHETALTSPEPACNVFRIRDFESNVAQEIPANEINAVFFVNDLKGKPHRKDLRFHAHEPILPGIWVQVQFPNGEVIEGVVENTIRFLIDPGFFLRPTDPDSNNKLVYVMKGGLVDHHVLGLTKL